MSDANDHGSSPDHDASVDRQEALAGLSERLRGIEADPLETRAAAFGDVHDELRAVLEGSVPDAGPDAEPGGRSDAGGDDHQGRR